MPLLRRHRKSTCGHEKCMDGSGYVCENLVNGCKELTFYDPVSKQHKAIENLCVDTHGFYLSWVEASRIKRQMIDISRIKDTRVGIKTDVEFCDHNLLEPFANKTVTVVTGTTLTELTFTTFIFSTPKEAEWWANSLFHLAYDLAHRHPSLETVFRKVYAQIHFEVGNKTKVSSDKVISYFIPFEKEERQKYKDLTQIDLSQVEFTFENFLAFVTKMMTMRSELKHHLWDKIPVSAPEGGKFSLTAEQLATLPNVEYEYHNGLVRRRANNEEIVDAARKIVLTHESNEMMRRKETLSLDGILRYLCSDENLTIHSTVHSVHHDMKRPLTEYFINTSHNTYLLGNQWGGTSSVEIYRQALLAGVRCVELDLWEAAGEEIVVTHGYTGCSAVNFRTCLRAIAQYAFKTSQYPVILSLQNECRPKLHDVIAKMLREELGSHLLEKPYRSFPLKPGKPLPSPDKLKNRILIKHKKHFITKDEKNRVEKSNSNNIERDPTILEPSKQEYQTDDEAVDEDDTETDGSIEDHLQLLSTLSTLSSALPMPNFLTSPAESKLSSLVNYIQSVPLKSFESARKTNRGHLCASLVEQRAYNYLKEKSAEIMELNKRQLTRIYPGNMRIHSSNFNPFLFWSAGCHMVAINIQKADRGCQLNTLMFEGNGGFNSGYLLKPELFRRTDRPVDPLTPTNIDGVVSLALSIQVFSGLMISKERAWSWVDVEIHGLCADESVLTRKLNRTKSTDANGINPQYTNTGKPFKFSPIIFPDLAYLRLAVYSDVCNSHGSTAQAKFVGTCLLPVAHIQPGYRYLVLKNAIGQPELATLFVKITVEEFIPNLHKRRVEEFMNPTEHINSKKQEYNREQLLQQINFIHDDQYPESEMEIEPAKKTAVRMLSSNYSGWESSPTVGVTTGSPTTNPFMFKRPHSNDDMGVLAANNFEWPANLSNSKKTYSQLESTGSVDSDDSSSQISLVHSDDPLTLMNLKHSSRVQKFIKKQQTLLEEFKKKAKKDIQRIKAVKVEEQELLKSEHEIARNVLEKAYRECGLFKMLDQSVSQEQVEREKSLAALDLKQQAEQMVMREKHLIYTLKTKCCFREQEYQFLLEQHNDCYNLLKSQLTLTHSALLEKLEHAHQISLKEILKQVHQGAKIEREKLKKRTDLTEAEVEREFELMRLNRGVTAVNDANDRLMMQKSQLEKKAAQIESDISMEKNECIRSLNDRFQKPLQIGDPDL